MAAGTRSKESVEEGLRNTDSRVHELMNSHHQLQKSVEDIGNKFNMMQSTMELIMTEFQRNVKGKGTTSENDIETVMNSPRTDRENTDKENEEHNLIHNNTTGNYNRNPRFDFPVFNGLDIRNWVMKCDYYFQFYPMADMLRMRTVALHLEGEAGSWFLS